MPLSELYQLTTNSKPDCSSQPNTGSADFSSSFMQNDEFVELLWENGQVVMHGQSSRPSKKFTTPFSPFQTQFQEKNSTNTNPTFSLFPKIPSFGSVDHLTETDFEPKSCIGLSSHEEDDSVPWINCSIDESLCSELLTDMNQIDNLVENQTSKNPVSIRSVPVLKLKNTDLTTQQQNKQNGSMNFSHFTRPAAKKGLQNEERLNNEKVSTSCNNNNPLESAVVQSSGYYEMPVLLPTFQKEMLSKNSFGENKTERERPKEKKKEREREKEKGGETERVGSSSVCSGNVEPKQRSKRKILEEDRDELDESVELKRSNSSKAGNIKRSRTAEVHNLSERRRRDRINEKMRALQELIPNCNKVDKASMLDEAIEYLKSLQLQVQMMSSGAGLVMPHMIFPPGFHHMKLPHFQIPHFQIPHLQIPHPPFVRTGYGFGIPDLNGCPSVQPPIMHGGRNVINGGIPMFGFPLPPVINTTKPMGIPDFEIPGLNKENAGKSCSPIESSSEGKCASGI